MSLKYRLPRLIIPDENFVCNYAFNRDTILDGTIPVYWGPKQPLYPNNPGAGAEYVPPGDWPAVGTLLCIPRVVRFVWQTAELDAEAWSAGGFSGPYTTGFKATHYIFNDVFAGEGSIPDSTEIPVHIDTSGETPTDTYHSEIIITFTGTLHIPDFGTFTVSGNTNQWLNLQYISGPYSLVSYYLPETMGLEATYIVLSTGFIPAHATTIPGLDPPVTTTPSGPDAVGLTEPMLTGRWSVDGTIYGTSSYGDGTPITVPDGYTPPIPIDPTIQPANWMAFSTALENNYLDSTNPWVSAFQFPTGNPLWIGSVSPIETFYLAGYSLHILVFSKVDMPMPSLADPYVLRIMSAYPYMLGYTVAIFIDTGYINDCHIPPGVLSSFIDSVQAFCDSMGSYGFIYGGSCDYKDTNSMNSTINNLIDQYLPNVQ